MGNNSFNNIFLANFLKREKAQYDFEDKEFYMNLISFLLLAHILLEGLYIYSYCTPMVYINLVSICVYMAEYCLNATDHNILMIWIGLLEIYLHMVLTTIFMGYECGFWLWMFPCVLSVVTPYFMPVKSKAQNILANLLVPVYVATFIILYALNRNGYLPTGYNAPESIATFFFYSNALISFSFIILYSTIYSVSIKQNSFRLKELANTDSLTGLYNRQSIQKIFYEGNGKSVAIMDVDHFKRINDTYGHLMGDHVLTEIAKLLSSHSNIYCGRWGGEEFLLIAKENVSYTNFCQTVESLCDEISDHVFSLGSEDIKVTSSFGAATYVEEMTPYDLLKEADSRLYVAKQHGRNSVVSA